MTTHKAECPLSSVHWLRHAVAAAGCLIQTNPPQHLDRTSAVSLTDTLAHFAELDDWATVTLQDVADHATLLNQKMNQERFKSWCKCGAFD